MIYNKNSVCNNVSMVIMLMLNFIYVNYVIKNLEKIALIAFMISVQIVALNY